MEEVLTRDGGGFGSYGGLPPACFIPRAFPYTSLVRAFQFSDRKITKVHQELEDHEEQRKLSISFFVALEVFVGLMISTHKMERYRLAGRPGGMMLGSPVQ